MKPLAFIGCFLAILVGCNNPTDNYLAKDLLSFEQQQTVLRSVIRYLGKPPGKGETDPEAHYEKELKNYRLDLYHVDDKTGYSYLMVSRIAPSLHVKKVGTGLKMKQEGDTIAYYEEAFRTWRMPEEELATKGLFLFSKLVKGEDLSPWYPQNSGKEEYIEFPDANTWYDTVGRAWRSRLEPF